MTHLESGVRFTTPKTLAELEACVSKYEWEHITPEPKLSKEELEELSESYCRTFAPNDEACGGCIFSLYGSCHLSEFKDLYNKYEEITGALIAHKAQKEQEKEEVRVGDIVRVVNTGKTRDTYADFVDKYCTEGEKLYWAVGSTPNTDIKYKVSRVVNEGGRDLAYIKVSGSIYCIPLGYVITIDGLEKVKQD